MLAGLAGVARAQPVDDGGGVDGDSCQGFPVSTTYGEQAAVRGDPDALDDLALTCRRTARALRADAARLRRADVSGWTGEAARAFMQSVHGLPRDLSLAADSYDTVAAALIDVRRRAAARCWCRPGAPRASSPT